MIPHRFESWQPMVLVNYLITKSEWIRNGVEVRSSSRSNVEEEKLNRRSGEPEMHMDTDLDPAESGSESGRIQDFYRIFLGSDPNKMPTGSGSE